jgi:hypothetical protein
MAYNFYSDLENIYKVKGDWEKANQSGDEKGKYNASAQAQIFYDNLRKNGYKDLADEMQNANYTQAKNIVNKWSSQKPQDYVYSPEQDVDNIFKAKGWYDDAKKAGDQAGADLIAAKTQAYYNNLINNGYNDLAYDLSVSNHEASKGIRNKWAKMDKTSGTEYLYTLGKSKGLSQDDINSLLKVNESTGEVYFGGKNLGKADAVVDGVAYWSDTSKLDNAFNNYIFKSGTTQTDEQLRGQHNTEIKDKINQLFGTQNKDRDMMIGKYGKLEDTAYSNPFETDEAKAILGQYDLKAMQGRENEKASGAASNGGNIDSFAAANALRQQASLINKGQMAVLDAHNNKINNVKGILADMGVYLQNQDVGMQNTIGLQQSESQRLFENDQTSKNNETARLSEQASVTGYAPNEWVIKNDSTYSQFLNPDGTFKKEMENVDLQALINNTTDADTKKKLAVIRAKKMLGNYGEYGQYIGQGDVAFMDNNIRTEAGKQFDETMQYNRDIFEAEQELKNPYSKLSGGTTRVVSSGGSSNKGSNKTTYTGNLTAAQAKSALLAGTVTEEVLNAYNHYYGTNYTMENPPEIVDGKIVTTDPGTLEESVVEKWADKLNDDIAEKYGDKYTALVPNGDGTYERGDADADYIILRVLGDDKLTQEQKEYLLYDRFGITEDQVNTAYRDPHYK